MPDRDPPLWGRLTPRLNINEADIRKAVEQTNQVLDYLDDNTD